MKVGLLADIHGNAAALEAALSAAKANGAERLLIAGDLVGYYYQPDVVLRRLEDWQVDIIRGNHEDMLQEWRAAADNEGPVRSEIRARYGSGLAAAESTLAAAQLAMLEKLPARCTLEIEGTRVLLCHGSPIETDAYLYPDASDSDWAAVLQPGIDMLVHGHTHYPVDRHVEGCRIVNPGSVGQPRDRRPGACWALWDTSTGTVDFRRESYDTGPLAVECALRDPQNPYLAEVLLRT